MTSYNLLNGVHTAERRDLIEDILRAEFGFRGIVMTDWLVAALNAGRKKYPVTNAARIAGAGGDLVMPGGPGDLKAMLDGMKDGTLTRRQLMINATRVFRLAKKLTSEPTTGSGGSQTRDKSQHNTTYMQYFEKGKRYTVLTEESCESNNGGKEA